MANPTAEEFKSQGNAAYALGDLALALELFESASALDPTSPVFLSNASATLYEMGRYYDALQVTTRAIDLNTSAPALAAKLALRRVKILLQLRRFAEAVELSADGDGEMVGLREIAVRLAAIPALSKDEASTLVLDLPVYKAAHPSVTMEYFAIGHDDGFSALSAPPDLEMSKTHEKRFKLDISGVDPISCVIGGSGDGRHAIATVFDIVHQMRLKGTKKPLQQPHVMLVDIVPASVSRLYLLLSFLHDLGAADGKDEKNALLAVLHYFYCGSIMPPSVHSDLIAAMRRARSRLSSTLLDPISDVPSEYTPEMHPDPPSPPQLSADPPLSSPWTSFDTLPPWLHFSPSHYPSILKVLDYWLDPMTTPHSLVGEWMDRTRQTPKHERRGPDETLPYIDLAQYEVYGRMKILFPSRSTLAREPKELREPLEQVMKSRKVEEQDVTVCSQYVRENWKANPVFLDPVTGDTVEYFKDPCGNFHNIIKSWSKAGTTQSLTNTPSIVLPITQMGLLKPLESSFVAFNCLLNTRIYPGAFDGRMAIAVNSTSLTSLGVTLQQLPATFGAQFVNVVPIAQLQEYALYSPLRSTPLSKIDIKNYIHATFLRLVLPSRNSSTKNVHTVREPLNLSSLFRILRRLHEAGYPAHHLTDALTPIFSNTLVTRARPPPDHIPLASPIPLSTAAPISTAPFLPELIVAASSRVLRGGRSADTIILHSSLTATYSGPDSEDWDVTFAMPVETVAKLWREGWSVTLWDLSASFAATEEVVCTERTVVCVGTLADRHGRGGD
ncbi:hypothetical protein RQP46_004228 [Phenoliferia psychrophenolica]